MIRFKVKQNVCVCVFICIFVYFERVKWQELNFFGRRKSRLFNRWLNRLLSTKKMVYSFQQLEYICQLFPSDVIEMNNHESVNGIVQMQLCNQKCRFELIINRILKFVNELKNKQTTYTHTISKILDRITIANFYNFAEIWKWNV